MKQLVIILLILVISGCDKDYQKEEFLGTWEIVSTTDSQTGAVDTLPDEYRFLVHLEPDSLYKENGVYGWEIIGDSIFVNEWPFYIIEVTDNAVLVETEYFFGGGNYLIEFKRRNKKYEKFDLLGTWEAVSETDLETGEVYEFQDDDKMIVEIKFDSLAPYGDQVYAWEIEKDSILVYANGWPWSFNIKELTESELIIEGQEWFGDSIISTKFKKQK